MNTPIETHGKLWDLRVEKGDRGSPKIFLEVSDKNEHSGPMHGGICPVCKNEVKEEEYFCHSCGAKLT